MSRKKSKSTFYCYKCQDRKDLSGSSISRKYGHRKIKQKICSSCGRIMTLIICGPGNKENK